MSGEDEFFDNLRALISANIQSEMRTQLARNPAADRRGLLDMALRFERQRIERGVMRTPSASDLDRTELRANLNALLEEIGNEIRAGL